MADITLLSTADWDHPLWTNKQHVARSLAALGHRVLYVESLGLRAPRRQSRDGRRILRRLRRALMPPRRVEPNLWVWSPLAIPGAGASPLLQALNRLVFSISLQLAERLIAFRPQLLWTYNPCTLAYLHSTARYPGLIYHCVDDVPSQPGMNAAWIMRWEQQLCRRADQVFVTSKALLESRHDWSGSIAFYPNVADYDHFSQAWSCVLQPAAELCAIPHPRLGFIGALSAYKLDLELIAALAGRHRDWSFVLVGPTGEGEQSADLSALLAHPNVHWLGAQPYGKLPSLLSGFDVALLPLRFNSYTESMFPMKFFEYLAAGLPVVATPIRSLLDYRDLVQLPSSNQPEIWAQAIATALADPPQARQARLAFAARNTYRSRTEAMLADLRRRGLVLASAASDMACAD